MASGEQLEAVVDLFGFAELTGDSSVFCKSLVTEQSASDDQSDLSQCKDGKGSLEKFPITDQSKRCENEVVVPIFGKTGVKKYKVLARQKVEDEEEEENKVVKVTDGTKGERESPNSHEQRKENIDVKHVVKKKTLAVDRPHKLFKETSEENKTKSLKQLKQCSNSKRKTEVKVVKKVAKVKADGSKKPTLNVPKKETDKGEGVHIETCSYSQSESKARDVKVETSEVKSLSVASASQEKVSSESNQKESKQIERKQSADEENLKFSPLKCTVKLNRDPSIECIVGSEDKSDGKTVKTDISIQINESSDNGGKECSQMRRQNSQPELKPPEMVYDTKNIEVRKSGRLKSAKCASRYRGDYGIRVDTYTKLVSQKSNNSLVDNEESIKTFVDTDSSNSGDSDCTEEKVTPNDQDPSKGLEKVHGSNKMIRSSKSQEQYLENCSECSSELNTIISSKVVHDDTCKCFESSHTKMDDAAKYMICKRHCVCGGFEDKGCDACKSCALNVFGSNLVPCSDIGSCKCNTVNSCDMSESKDAIPKPGSSKQFDGGTTCENNMFIQNVKHSDNFCDSTDTLFKRRTAYVHSVGKSVQKKRVERKKTCSDREKNVENLLSPDSSPVKERLDPTAVLETLRQRLFEKAGADVKEADKTPKTFESAIISSKRKLKTDSKVGDIVMQQPCTPVDSDEISVVSGKSSPRCVTPKSEISAEILEEISISLEHMQKERQKVSNKGSKPCKTKKPRFQEKKFLLRSMVQGSTPHSEMSKSEKLNELEPQGNKEIKPQYSAIKENAEETKASVQTDIQNSEEVDNSDLKLTQKAENKKSQGQKKAQTKPKPVKCPACNHMFKTRDLLRKHYPCRVRQTRTWSQNKLRPNRAVKRPDPIPKKFTCSLPKVEKSDKPRPQLLLNRKTKFRKVKGKRRRRLYQAIQERMQRRQKIKWPHLSIFYDDLSFKEQSFYKIGLMCVGRSAEGLEKYSADEIDLFEKHRAVEKAVSADAESFERLPPDEDDSDQCMEEKSNECDSVSPALDTTTDSVVSENSAEMETLQIVKETDCGNTSMSTRSRSKASEKVGIQVQPTNEYVQKLNVLETCSQQDQDSKGEDLADGISTTSSIVQQSTVDRNCVDTCTSVMLDFKALAIPNKETHLESIETKRILETDNIIKEHSFTSYNKAEDLTLETVTTLETVKQYAANEDNEPIQTVHAVQVSMVCTESPLNNNDESIDETTFRSKNVETCLNKPKEPSQEIQNQILSKENIAVNTGIEIQLPEVGSIPDHCTTDNSEGCEGEVSAEQLSAEASRELEENLVVNQTTLLSSQVLHKTESLPQTHTGDETSLEDSEPLQTSFIESFANAADVYDRQENFHSGQEAKAKEINIHNSASDCLADSDNALQSALLEDTPSIPTKERDEYKPISLSVIEKMVIPGDTAKTFEKDVKGVIRAVDIEQTLEEKEAHSLNQNSETSEVENMQIRVEASPASNTQEKEIKQSSKNKKSKHLTLDEYLVKKGMSPHKARKRNNSSECVQDFTKEHLEIETSYPDFTDSSILSKPKHSEINVNTKLIEKASDLLKDILLDVESEKTKVNTKLEKKMEDSFVSTYHSYSEIDDLKDENEYDPECNYLIDDDDDDLIDSSKQDDSNTAEDKTYICDHSAAGNNEIAASLLDKLLAAVGDINGIVQEQKEFCVEKGIEIDTTNEEKDHSISSKDMEFRESNDLETRHSQDKSEMFQKDVFQREHSDDYSEIEFNMDITEGKRCSQQSILCDKVQSDVSDSVQELESVSNETENREYNAIPVVITNRLRTHLKCESKQTDSDIEVFKTIFDNLSDEIKGISDSSPNIAIDLDRNLMNNAAVYSESLFDTNEKESSRLVSITEENIDERENINSNLELLDTENIDHNLTEKEDKKIHTDCFSGNVCVDSCEEKHEIISSQQVSKHSDKESFEELTSNNITEELKTTESVNVENVEETRNIPYGVSAEETHAESTDKMEQLVRMKENKNYVIKYEMNGLLIKENVLTGDKNLVEGCSPFRSTDSESAELKGFTSAQDHEEFSGATMADTILNESQESETSNLISSQEDSTCIADCFEEGSKNVITDSLSDDNFGESRSIVQEDIEMSKHSSFNQDAEMCAIDNGNKAFEESSVQHQIETEENTTMEIENPEQLDKETSTSVDIKEVEGNKNNSESFVLETKNTEILTREMDTTSVELCRENSAVVVSKDTKQSKPKTLLKELKVILVPVVPSPPVLEKVETHGGDTEICEDISGQDTIMSMGSEPPTLEPESFQNKEGCEPSKCNSVNEATVRKEKSERHFLDVLGFNCDSTKQPIEGHTISEAVSLDATSTQTSYKKGKDVNENIGRHFSDVMSSQPETPVRNMQFLLDRSEKGEMTLAQIKNIIKPIAKKKSLISKESLIKIQCGIANLLSKVKKPEKKDPVWLKRDALSNYAKDKSYYSHFRSFSDSESEDEQPEKPELELSIEQGQKTSKKSLADNIMQMLQSFEDKGSIAVNMSNLFDILAENLGFVGSSGKNLGGQSSTESESEDDEDDIYKTIKKKVAADAENEIDQKQMIANFLDDEDGPPSLDEIPTAEDVMEGSFNNRSHEEICPSDDIQVTDGHDADERALDAKQEDEMSTEDLINKITEKEVEKIQDEYILKSNVGDHYFERNPSDNEVLENNHALLENVERLATSDTIDYTRKYRVEVENDEELMKENSFEEIENFRKSEENVSDMDNVERYTSDDDKLIREEETSSCISNDDADLDSAKQFQASADVRNCGSPIIPHTNEECNESKSKANTIFKSITELNSIETDEESNCSDSFDEKAMTLNLSELKVQRKHIDWESNSNYETESVASNTESDDNDTRDNDEDRVECSLRHLRESADRLKVKSQNVAPHVFINNKNINTNKETVETTSQQHISPDEIENIQSHESIIRTNELISDANECSGEHKNMGRQSSVTVTSEDLVENTVKSEEGADGYLLNKEILCETNTCPPDSANYESEDITYPNHINETLNGDHVSKTGMFVASPGQPCSPEHEESNDTDDTSTWNHSESKDNSKCNECVAMTDPIETNLLQDLEERSNIEPEEKSISVQINDLPKISVISEDSIDSAVLQQPDEPENIQQTDLCADSKGQESTFLCIEKNADNEKSITVEEKNRAENEENELEREIEALDSYPPVTSSTAEPKENEITPYEFKVDLIASDPCCEVTIKDSEVQNLEFHGNMNKTVKAELDAIETYLTQADKITVDLNNKKETPKQSDKPLQEGNFAIQKETCNFDVSKELSELDRKEPIEASPKLEDRERGDAVIISYAEKVTEDATETNNEMIPKEHSFMYSTESSAVVPLVPELSKDTSEKDITVNSSVNKDAKKCEGPENILDEETTSIQVSKCKSPEFNEDAVSHKSEPVFIITPDDYIFCESIAEKVKRKQRERARPLSYNPWQYMNEAFEPWRKTPKKEISVFRSSILEKRAREKSLTKEEEPACSRSKKQKFFVPKMLNKHVTNQHSSVQHAANGMTNRNNYLNCIRGCSVHLSRLSEATIEKYTCRKRKSDVVPLETEIRPPLKMKIKLNQIVLPPASPYASTSVSSDTNRSGYESGSESSEMETDMESVADINNTINGSSCCETEKLGTDGQNSDNNRKEREPIRIKMKELLTKINSTENDPANAKYSEDKFISSDISASLHNQNNCVQKSDKYSALKLTEYRQPENEEAENRVKFYISDPESDISKKHELNDYLENVDISKELEFSDAVECDSDSDQSSVDLELQNKVNQIVNEASELLDEEESEQNERSSSMEMIEDSQTLHVEPILKGHPSKIMNLVKTNIQLSESESEDDVSQDDRQNKKESVVSEEGPHQKLQKDIQPWEVSCKENGSVKAMVGQQETSGARDSLSGGNEDEQELQTYSVDKIEESDGTLDDTFQTQTYMETKNETSFSESYVNTEITDTGNYLSSKVENLISIPEETKSKSVPVSGTVCNEQENISAVNSLELDTFTAVNEAVCTSEDQMVYYAVEESDYDEVREAVDNLENVNIIEEPLIVENVETGLCEVVGTEVVPSFIDNGSSVSLCEEGPVLGSDQNQTSTREMDTPINGSPNNELNVCHVKSKYLYGINEDSQSSAEVVEELITDQIGASDITQEAPVILPRDPNEDIVSVLEGLSTPEISDEGQVLLTGDEDCRYELDTYALDLTSDMGMWSGL